MRLVRLIANLGYGTRKDVAWMFREGRVTDQDGEVLYADVFAQRSGACGL